MSKSVRYIATGAVRDAILAHFRAANEHVAYMRDLGATVGADNIFRGHAGVCGFSLPSRVAVPVALRRDARTTGMYVPNRKSAEGKALAKAMTKAPPYPSTQAVMNAAGLKRETYYRDGQAYLSGVGFEMIGDVAVLDVPAMDGRPVGGEPVECERIPESRYWTLKEAVEVRNVE